MTIINNNSTYLPLLNKQQPQADATQALPFQDLVTMGQPDSSARETVSVGGFDIALPYAPVDPTSVSYLQTGNKLLDAGYVEYARAAVAANPAAQALWNQPPAITLTPTQAVAPDVFFKGSAVPLELEQRPAAYEALLSELGRIAEAEEKLGGRLHVNAAGEYSIVTSAESKSARDYMGITLQSLATSNAERTNEEYGLYTELLKKYGVDTVV